MRRSRAHRRRSVACRWLVVAAVVACVAAGLSAEAGEGVMGGIVGQSLWDSLARGGRVMYVILGFSAMGLAFILESSFRCRQSAILPRAAERALLADDPDIGELLDDGNKAVVHSVLRAGHKWRNESHDQIATAIEEIVDENIWQLKRSARPIGIIANTTPLLGLLGTVIGIIQAFDVVASQGALGDPGALAGGISKALLTTCFGLIVSIPMLLSYHFLTGKIETLVRRCEILAKQKLIIPPE